MKGDGVDDDVPLDLVADAGDGVVDFVGGGLGAVRSDLVGDLCGGLSVMRVWVMET